MNLDKLKEHWKKEEQYAFKGAKIDKNLTIKDDVIINNKIICKVNNKL